MQANSYQQNDTMFSRQVEQQSSMGMYFKFRMYRMLIGLGLGAMWAIGSLVFGGLRGDDSSNSSSYEKTKKSSVWSGSSKKKSSGFQRYYD